MTGIWWNNDEVRVKKYGSTTAGTKTTIRIELEASDHYVVASLMRSIEEAKASEPAPSPRSKAKEKVGRQARIGQSTEQLLITHDRGDDR